MRDLALSCEIAHTYQMNRIVWVGASKDDVRAFPVDARRDVGFQLSKVRQVKIPTTGNR
jgi:phage-related protein